MADTPLAVITGAARGIGLACAEVLAEAGHRVVLVDVDEATARAAAARIGSDALAIGCDVGTPDQVSEMVEQVLTQEGPVSVLVNNAGIAAPAPFLDVSVEDWERVLSVNLTGALVATQAVAKGMIAHGIKGAVVNMSSINAHVAIPSVAAYCASKGGLTQLTKAAALALAPHGIRVNAVGPGSIDTPMMATVNDDPAAMERIMMRTPMKRVGGAREIADIVAFLASDKASYITGETIYADGGRIAMNYTC